jgi:hypothetical protein
LTELEVDVDALLERLQPKLFEPPNLALSEGLEGKIRERRTPPELKRIAELPRPLRWLRLPSLRDQPLEPPRVELIRLDAEKVPRCLCYEDVRAEQLAELGDEVL